MNAVKIRWFLMLTLALLSGCQQPLQIYPASHDSAVDQKAELEIELDARQWWQLRFRLAWPQRQQPDFSRHLLLAEQLLLPALLEHEQRLTLWRFHRRANRDDAGHQFSLIFLSDEITAKQLYRDIEQQPLTRWLLQQGMIERVHFSSRSEAQLAALEQTSDPVWPIEIQRSWPWFIMGASQTWLKLLQQISSDQSRDDSHTPMDYPALLTHYQTVDVELTQQWQQFGQHAYLHHLNAIFGYQPLQIHNRQLHSF